MRLRFFIIAIGALCCLFFGCGCSKENQAVDDGVPARIKDAAYTNQLAQLLENRNALASKVAALRDRIAKFGPEMQGTPVFIELTNQLAQCEAESDHIRKTTLNVIRTKVMKEASQKGVLKK